MTDGNWVMVDHRFPIQSVWERRGRIVSENKTSVILKLETISPHYPNVYHLVPKKLILRG